jgi:Uma2 family endonuclease
MTAALQLPSLLDDPSLLENKQDWTVDDLANLPKDLRYELIDGRLILPSPTFLHQDICAEVRNMLRVNCPPGYRPYVDVSLTVDGQNEPRPDVVVARMAVGMRSPAPIQAALLAVEVISPTSHFRDMDAKKKLFAAAGIGSYWVIDPTFEKGVVLTEFRLGDNGLYDTVTNTDKAFVTDVPYRVTINLPALTEIREEHRRAEAEE